MVGAADCDELLRLSEVPSTSLLELDVDDDDSLLEELEVDDDVSETLLLELVELLDELELDVLDEVSETLLLELLEELELDVLDEVSETLLLELLDDELVVPVQTWLSTNSVSVPFTTAFASSNVSGPDV